MKTYRFHASTRRILMLLQRPSLESTVECGGIGAVIDHNTGQAYTYPGWLQLIFGRTLVFDRKDEKENTPVPPTPDAPEKK